MSIFTTTIQLLPNQTGQTLTAQLYDTAGVAVGTSISTGFVEAENGDYVWSHTFTEDFNGFVSFFISSVYQATASINVTITEEVDLSEVIDAIESLEASLAASSITVISPFEANSSNFTITRGDDYSTALGNAIVFTSEDWPDLSTASSIRLSAKHVYTGAYDLEEITVTAVQGSGDEQTLTLELTNAETQPLSVGLAIYKYDIQATIDGEKITLVNGVITVNEDVEDREVAL